MQRAHEKLWEYEAVVIGQEGTLTHVPITADTIRAYALAVQHHHTRYVAPETFTEDTQGGCRNANHGVGLRTVVALEHRCA